MTDKKVDFSSFFNWAETQDAYWSELAIIQFTEEIVRYMKKSNINRVELADRLDVSPAYITKLLKGDNNFTIETMAKIAYVLGSELKLHLVPKGSNTKWLDVLENNTKEEAPKAQPINISDYYPLPKNVSNNGMEVIWNETFAIAG